MIQIRKKSQSKFLIIILSSFFCVHQALATSETFKALPRFSDVIFLTTSNFGGYGRLVYQAASNRYNLVDGRINSYVVDGKEIRRMNPEESGGSMDNPQRLVDLDGKLFGNSSYGQITQLDPMTGQLMAKLAVDDFKFSGGSQFPLYAGSSSLLVMNGDQIIAFNSNLKKVGEKKLQQTAGHVRLSQQFIQAVNRLYALEVDNPNTYTNCVNGCNLPIVIQQTTIDFSQPKEIQVIHHEEKIKEQVYYSNKSLLPQQGWILVQSPMGQKQSTMEWRTFDSLAKVKANLKLPAGTQILAMTPSDPLWMVLKTKEGAYELGSLKIQNQQLSLKTSPIDWVKGSSIRFQIQSTPNGSLLYVAANHQLAVYDISAPVATRVLQQDFVGRNGSAQFQFEQLILADLPYTQTPLDRARLEAILKKNYWEDKDHLVIEAEISKIKIQDQWVIPLFISILKSSNSLYSGGMSYAAEVLQKFGPQAADALPLLLDQNLGLSYSQPQRDLAFATIKKIDPMGIQTIKLVQANLKDSSKVGATVKLLEYIGSPQTLELALTTKSRWKL